jgi:membrane-bound inhibitor of C-type lysozyme
MSHDEHEVEGPPPPTTLEKLLVHVDAVMTNHHRANIAIIVFVLIGLVVAIALGAIVTFPVSPERMQARTGIHTSAEVTAVFNCDLGKSVAATFAGNQVELFLSDGRTLQLGQVVSASGARYANPDESFVFWNKGGTAFIAENGIETYSNCSEAL